MLIVSCSTHFSTAHKEGKVSTIYKISEQRAFEIAYKAIITVLPGSKILEINGPIRGYSTVFRFMVDTYTQQVIVIPATGISLDGEHIEGYYFEVSGSGSSFVQGRNKNVKLYETLKNLLEETKSEITVTNLQQSKYKDAKWGKESIEPIKPSETYEASIGTGFAVSSNGILVTANHIVEGKTKIHVKFAEGKWIPAILVRYSRSTDIAVLQIENTPPAYLSLKPTNTLKIGDPVFTVGFPVIELLGPEPKYTDGKISSLSGIKGEDSLMQITVPIQPGSSGGPLVALDGYVVGLVTSTAAVKYFYAITETLPQNINWAVKADYILPMLNDKEVKPLEKKTDNYIQMVSKAICLVKAE